jgi:predicted GIY-YIG superfamily endonuclease
LKSRRKQYYYYIYLLRCNKTKRNLYVGVTHNLSQRFSGHKNTTLKNYKNKKHVTIQLLQKCRYDKASDREQYWYNYYLNNGGLVLQNKCNHFSKFKECKLNLFQLAGLCYLFDKDYQTIRKWANKNSVLFTIKEAAEIIEKFKNAPNEITPLN